MLDDPRELLARAELPLTPLDAPPNDPPPRLLELTDGDVDRLPTRSPPPPPRLMSLVPADGPLLLPEPRSIVPADGPDWRPPIWDWFCLAVDCRDDIESPRADPPYLFAVARSE